MKPYQNTTKMIIKEVIVEYQKTKNLDNCSLIKFKNEI